MDPVDQKKLAELRTRLAAFDYHEFCGFESFTLVDRLFSDLVSTTEVYQQLHEREEQLSQELGLVQAQLFPLRKQNATLTRENNTLHLDNIKQAEECRKTLDEVTVKNKLLEDHLEEMKFLEAQKDQAIHDKESEVEALRQRLEAYAVQFGELEDAEDSSKTLHDTTLLIRRPNDKALLSSSRPLRKQRGTSNRYSLPEQEDDEEEEGYMSVEEMKSRDVSVSVLAKQDSASEAALAILRRQVEALRGQVEEAEKRASLAERAIVQREREIERLGKALETGKDFQGISVDQIQEANRKIIDQLNIQVDFLNHQLAEYRQQGEEKDERLEALERLRAQLSELEAEKESIEESNDRLRQESARLSEANQRRSTELDELREELASLRAAGQQPQSSEPTVILPPSSDVELLRAEKQLLVAQVAALQTSLEQQQQEEGSHGLERQTTVVVGRDSSERWKEEAQAERMEALERSAVEHERSHEAAQAAKDDEVARLTKENEVLTASMARLSASLTAAERSNESLKDRLRVAEDNEAELTLEALASSKKKEADDGGEVPKQRDGNQWDREDLQAAVRALEEECACLRSLAEERGRVAESREAEGRELDGTVSALRDEMRSLRGQLHDTDAALQRAREDLHAAELGQQRRQHEADLLRDQQLRRDRQGSEGRAASLRQEQRRCAEEASAHRDVSQASLSELEALRGELARCRSQREASETACQLLRHELEACEARHAATQQRHGVEREQHARAADELGRCREECGRLATLHDVQAGTLRTVERDRADLEGTVKDLRAERSVLEHRTAEQAAELELARQQLGDARSRLTATERELLERRADDASDLEAQRDREASQRRTAEQALAELRDTCATLERSLADSQDRLLDAEGTVSELRQRSAEQTREAEGLRRELQSVTDTLTSREETVRRLRSSALELDRERDAALRCADELEERCRTAERDREALSRSLEEQRRESHQLELDLDSLRGQQERRDGSREAVESEARRCGRELEECRRVLRVRTEELRTASEDLEALTKENEAVHRTVTEVMQQRDSLQVQARRHLDKATTAEQHAKVARAERKDLLENYRRVCVELSEAKGRLTELSQSRQALGKQIGDQDSECARLATALRTAELAIQKKGLDMAALERQLANLSSSHRAVERRLAASSDENKRLLADLRGQRQHHKLSSHDTGKLQGQLQATADEVSSLRTRCSRLEAERVQAQQEVTRLSRQCNQLEHLLQLSRARQARAEAQLAHRSPPASSPSSSDDTPPSSHDTSSPYQRPQRPQHHQQQQHGRPADSSSVSHLTPDTMSGYRETPSMVENITARYGAALSAEEDRIREIKETRGSAQTSPESGRRTRGETPQKRIETHRGTAR